MATPMRARLRKAWFYLHMWVGVGLFVALVPICVTGAYEVWHEELDRVANPARYETTVGELKAPSAYLAAAQAAFGDRATAASVRFPQHPGDPVVVSGPINRPDSAARGGPRRPPSLTAWVDPASGKVLDVADLSKSYRQVIHRIHGSLLIPEVGRKVVGWMGWALFASCVSGLWLWWPRGSLAKGLRYRRTGNTLLNLHYTGGFWICIPLAVLALSGVFISFPQSTRGALATVAEVSPQQPRGGPGGGGRPTAKPVLPMDQAVEIARAAAPGRELLSVTVPSRGKDSAWRVQFSGGTEPATVEVEDAAGANGRLQPARQVAPGDALLRLNRRIHDGADTGVVWRSIITLAGLIPAMLGVTGLIVWAQRQLRKARLRRPDLEPAAAE